MEMKVSLFAAASSVLPAPPLAAPAAATVAGADLESSNCTRRCGSISIPPPFGVEPWCHLPGLNVTCRDDGSVFLGDGTVQVLEITIANATVRINASFAYFPDGFYNDLSPKPITEGTWALGKGGPYNLAPLGRNRLFAVGCNIQVLLVGDRNKTLGTCAALCDWDDHDRAWSFPDSTCYGIACCQANIMVERSSYEFRALRMNGATGPKSDAVVWIVESGSSLFDDVMHSPYRSLPSMLAWRINNTTCHGNASSAACRSSHSFCENATTTPTAGLKGHLCKCAQGYQGNPYVANGCKDVNECDYPETYPCHGDCNNTQGGYRCQCLPGFKGNASVPNGCKDIDECAHPDRYSCYGLCINMHGTFHCHVRMEPLATPSQKGAAAPSQVTC